MPDDLDNNQSNNINQRPHEGREHETHWTALILLALGSLVVIVVVFLAAGNQPSPADTSPAETTTQVDQESHGSVIPAEQVQTQEETDLSGLPTDLYLPEDREIVRNFSADLTDTTQQRVVVFDTNTSSQALKDDFTQWIESSSFDITDTSETTIRTTDGSEQLIMSISPNDDRQRVQVNYLTKT